MKTIITFVLVTFFAFALELQKPKVYSGEENVTGWLMSEKLDGIMGYWD